MTSQHQRRTPAGSPEGGQFAASAGTESDATLAAPAPRPGITKPHMAGIDTVQPGDVFADGEFARNETVKHVMRLDDGDYLVETGAQIAHDAKPYQFKPGDQVWVIQPRPASSAQPRIDQPGDRFESPEGPAEVLAISELPAGAYAPGSRAVVYQPDGYASPRTFTVGPHHSELPPALTDKDTP